LEKADKLEALIDGAEELLINLADAHDPAIQALRDRVDRAIADAKRSIEGQDDPAVRLRDVLSSIDDYVQNYPWLAVATGILAAGAVAFIAGSTIGAKKRLDE